VYTTNVVNGILRVLVKSTVLVADTTKVRMFIVEISGPGKDTEKLSIKV
jgi:hypothetical protein